MLAGGWRDREIDRVAALPPEEAGIRPSDEMEERGDMCRLAEERREEAVQRHGYPARHERRRPGGDDRSRGRNRPQREPAEVRNDEQRPECDEQPRPAEVAVEADRDRVCSAAFHGRILRAAVISRIGA